MSAVHALRAAERVGVYVVKRGDSFFLQSDAKPPPEVLSLLREHRVGIIEAVTPDPSGWIYEDYRALFYERAGIAEFDHGLERDAANKRAWGCCVAEWLDRNPEPGRRGTCALCGGGRMINNPLTTYGIRATHQVDLHPKCWREWYEKRRATAARALAKMGIEP